MNYHFKLKCNSSPVYLQKEEEESILPFNRSLNLKVYDQTVVVFLI